MKERVVLLPLVNKANATIPLRQVTSQRHSVCLAFVAVADDDDRGTKQMKLKMQTIEQ